MKAKQTRLLPCKSLHSFDKQYHKVSQKPAYLGNPGVEQPPSWHYIAQFIVQHLAFSVTYARSLFKSGLGKNSAPDLSARLNATARTFREFRSATDVLLWVVAAFPVPINCLDSEPLPGHLLHDLVRPLCPTIA